MIKIYGKNCIYAAVLAKAKLETIFVSNDVIKKDNKILKLLSDNSLSPKIVDKAFLDKEFGDGHQGYGAYRSDYKILSIDDINMIPKEKGRILILDGIQDPQNLGAIIRSVDAFSYDLIVLPKHNSVSVNKTVAHVSTGAIEYVNIMYVNSLLTLINKLKDMGYWICGTDAKGNVLAENIDKNLNLAI